MRFHANQVTPAPGTDLDETTMLWLADVEIPCEVFALILPLAGLEGVDAEMTTRIMQAARGRTLVLVTLGCFGPRQDGGTGMVAKALAAGCYGSQKAADQPHDGIQRQAWSRLMALANGPVPLDDAVSGMLSLHQVTDAQIAGALHLEMANEQGAARGRFTARRCYVRYPPRP